MARIRGPLRRDDPAADALLRQKPVERRHHIQRIPLHAGDLLGQEPAVDGEIRA
jgi:hypothetical protein